MIDVKKETSYIIDKNQKIYYHHYQINVPNQRCLLLLNGSRLGGEQTWAPIIPFLKHWSQILVLEVRGTGELNPLDYRDDTFTAEDIIRDIEQLLARYHWNDFDQAGYSFGGFIGMLLKAKFKNRIGINILFESALIADTDEALPKLVSSLEKIVDLMSVEPDKGNDLFSTLVSPACHGSPLLKSLNSKRKIHNPLGFANLMLILIEYYRDIQLRWRIIESQHPVISVLTEYAPPGTIAMAQHIKQHCAHWHFKYVSGIGHSLPFAKPATAGYIINEVHEDLIVSNG